MAEIVTLQLPETLAQKAKQIAAFTHRRLEDVLLEWIDRAITELPVESLPDDQVLVMCDLQMEAEQQEVFSELLARHREGALRLSDDADALEVRSYWVLAGWHPPKD
ncbi:MAG: hypothetical protein ACSI46_02035 [Gloeotrichia echinulata DVL01]|jgi:hypothetical protein